MYGEVPTGLDFVMKLCVVNVRNLPALKSHLVRFFSTFPLINHFLGVFLPLEGAVCIGRAQRDSTFIFQKSAIYK